MLGIGFQLRAFCRSQSQFLPQIRHENRPIKPKCVRFRSKFLQVPINRSKPIHLLSSQTQIPVINLSTMANPSDEMSPRRGPITHIIFDMDGLLLDTEKFYTEVQEKILAGYGKTFDWSLKAKMMGKKAIEAARVFVEETGISDSLTAEQFLERREDMLLNLFPTSELMPGVARLVNHFHANGVPMAVATGSHRRHFELKTQNHGDIISMMHHVVTGDDPEVKQGKPSPDIFFAAAKRFEDEPVNPSKILVFEDAPSGVGAAKNAGMSVVMVPDPRLDDSFHASADQVISSLMDFNPSDWGLPPISSDAAATH